MSQNTIRPFHIFKKALKCFSKVINCMQQLQVREDVVGFEKALGAVNAKTLPPGQYRESKASPPGHKVRKFHNVSINSDTICIAVGIS